MTSKSTWMWAKATPPGGMVATFRESRRALVFFPERPVLYRIAFQLLVSPLPRSTAMPCSPSTRVPVCGSGVITGPSSKLAASGGMPAHLGHLTAVHSTPTADAPGEHRRGRRQTRVRRRCSIRLQCLRFRRRCRARGKRELRGKVFHLASAKAGPAPQPERAAGEQHSPAGQQPRDGSRVGQVVAKERGDREDGRDSKSDESQPERSCRTAME